MDCPSDDSLEKYRTGEVSEQEKPELETHLEGCDSCVQRLKDLDSRSVSATADQPIGLPWMNETAKSSIVFAPGAEPISDYQLVKHLGSGGFGQVWEARAPGDVPIALKFVSLRDRLEDDDLREVNLLKNIRHPHLLTMSGTWQKDGYLIIAMGLAEGTLLQKYKEAKGQGHDGIPFDILISYIHDAAKGIDFMNEPRHPWNGKGPVGIQHRDIKPQNLLLVGGSVQVADFGLARILKETATSHTGSMTPAYAAPEFFGGKTSNQSDQYSLAVTYCHMRGGKLPFDGTLETIMHGHLTGDPDLSMLPEEERPIIRRALNKVPEKRWPSCVAMVEALRASKQPNFPWRNQSLLLPLALAIFFVVGAIGIVLVWRPWESDNGGRPQGKFGTAILPVNEGIVLAKPAPKVLLEEVYRQTFRVSAKTYIGDNGLSGEAKTNLRLEKDQKVRFQVSGNWSAAQNKNGIDLLTVAIGESGKNAFWVTGGSPEFMHVVEKSGWLFLGITDPFVRDNSGEVEVVVTVFSGAN